MLCWEEVCVFTWSVSESERFILSLIFRVCWTFCWAIGAPPGWSSGAWMHIFGSAYTFQYIFLRLKLANRQRYATSPTLLLNLDKNHRGKQKLQIINLSQYQSPLILSSSMTFYNKIFASSALNITRSSLVTAVFDLLGYSRQRRLHWFFWHNQISSYNKKWWHIILQSSNLPHRYFFFLLLIGVDTARPC